MPFTDLSAATRSLIDELSLTLPADLDAIRGEWDGDNSGVLEDRANAAEDAAMLFKLLTKTLEEL